MFHKWNSPPELINFALLHLPSMYAIPGQHDLPYHRYEDIKRSAYWTLVQSGLITNLPANLPYAVGRNITAVGFPWGTKLRRIDEGQIEFFLAVVHRYVWKDGHAHLGALEEDHISVVREELKGFDVALFGDNHSQFVSLEEGSPVVFNHGTFVRRRSDERGNIPAVGILYNNGDIDTRNLDVSGDQWTDVPDPLELRGSGVDPERFVEFMKDLEEIGISYTDAVQQFMRTEKMSPLAKNLMTMWIQKKDAVL